MEHRHLLPDEFDLLLDGEVGFGVTPLRAHVRRCAECRAELEAQRSIVAELERLPHLAPSSLFADRVMAQVQVFEPAQVTAVDTVRRWLPESRPARVFVGAIAAFVAVFISGAAFWTLARLDGVVALSGPLAARARLLTGQAIGEVVASAFGPSAAASLSANGPAALAMALTALLAAIALAAFALRRLASASRRP